MANITQLDEPLSQLRTPAVVAVVGGSGVAKGLIGMASIDTNSGLIELRQFHDTPDFTILEQRLEVIRSVHSTTEVLIPSSMMNDEKSQYIIRSKFGLNTNPIDRANFNDVIGLECIRKLSHNPQNLITQVGDKTFSLSALSALITYVENNLQSNLSVGAVKITYMTNEGSMIIDTESVAALELLASTGGNSKNCLYGFLGHTLTRGGCKQLRSLILEPPTDIEKINNRQNAIAELKRKEDVFQRLGGFLQLIQVDLERVASKIVQVPRGSADGVSRLETEVDLLVYLKHVLERMDSLSEHLSHLENEAFKSLNSKLDKSGYQKILGMIREVISDECVMTKGCVNFKTTKAFAIRKELSQYLEIERDSYSEILRDLTDLSEEIKRMHGFDDKGFKLIYSVARKFHLQISQTLFENPDDSSSQIIPTEFVRVEQKGDNVYCTTHGLLMMNSRLEFKYREINRASHVFVRELLEKIRSSITPIYTVAEVISEVDFLISLATVTIKYDLVQPTFDDDETNITDGKHPILMTLTKEEEGIIPNDTNLNSIANFHLITGPNMAGKSVYIRQVALLQVLAQIGCHVPAKTAKFRIRDRIFARIGSDDDIETNCSTFQREVSQIKYITENISENSLVIIDELGRGTSDEEGVGICFAVAEHLVASKAFTLFATHFQDLHQLSQLYHSVVSYHFTTCKKMGKNETKFIEYTHKLEERKDDVEVGDYGIDLAETGGLPPSLIEEARSILAQILKKQGRKIVNNGEAQKLRMQCNVANHIKKLAHNNRTHPIPNFAEYLETVRTKALQELIKMKQKE